VAAVAAARGARARNTSHCTRPKARPGPTIAASGAPSPCAAARQVRKGDSIGVFLKAVRDQLAPEFRELRALGTDGLMYIKVWRGRRGPGGLRVWATSGSDWATSGSDWATSGSDWATSGSDWATSGSDWATSGSDWATRGALTTLGRCADMPV
jgi:hypothetical protein